MRGAETTRPSRKVVDVLSAVIPGCRVMSVARAGHMGPITHAAQVDRMIATHARANESFVAQIDSGQFAGAQVAA